MSKLHIDTEMTGQDTLPAIRLYIGPVQLTMHTRTAVDLHHKIGKTLCDWTCWRTGQLIPEGMLHAGNDRFGHDQDMTVRVAWDDDGVDLCIGKVEFEMPMADIARLYHKLGKVISAWNFDALATVGG